MKKNVWRVSLVVLAALSSWAQDMEVFKLTDGREFVGNYDPQTKVLTARVGGGIIGMPMGPERIVSRRLYVPPVAEGPKPVSTHPPAQTPTAPEVVPAIPKDQYVYSDEEKLREIELWDAAEGKPTALNERFKRLNPCSPAMLRAKAKKDFPLRYRCLIALAEPVPPRLQGIAHLRWVLAAYDDAGACFGYLLVNRDTAEGKRVEQMLQKEPFAALHAWIDRRPGSDEEFVVDRIIADHWNPRMDGK